MVWPQADGLGHRQPAWGRSGAPRNTYRSAATPSRQRMYHPPWAMRLNAAATSMREPIERRVDWEPRTDLCALISSQNARRPARNVPAGTPSRFRSSSLSAAVPRRGRRYPAGSAVPVLAAARRTWKLPQPQFALAEQLCPLFRRVPPTSLRRGGFNEALRYSTRARVRAVHRST